MNENLSPIQPPDIRNTDKVVLGVFQDAEGFTFSYDRTELCGHDFLMIAQELISKAQDLLIHSDEEKEGKN